MKMKVLPLAAIAAGGYLFYNSMRPSNQNGQGSGGGTQQNGGGGTTPVLQDGGGQVVTTGQNDMELSIGELPFELDPRMMAAIEKAKQQNGAFYYAAYLQEMESNGGDILLAIKTVYDFWNQPDNPMRLNIESADAMLFRIAQASQTINQTAGIGSAQVEWNSTPVYDTFDNWWNGVPDIWTCADWKVWHQKLEQHFNNTYQANQVWEQAWSAPDNQCWVLGAFGCPDTSYCRYECDFVEYLASKEVNIGNLFSNTVCDLSQVVSNITGSVVNVSSGLKTASYFIVPAAAVALYFWLKK